MKRLITLCAIALICSLSTFAQSGNAKKQKGDKQQKNRTEKICKKLNLDEKQAKAFKEINTDFVSDSKKLKEKTAKDRAERRSEMKELQAEKNEEIKKILSKEQYEQYTTLCEARDKKQKNKRKNSKK